MPHAKTDDVVRTLRAGDDTMRAEGTALATALELFARAREAMSAYARTPTPEGAEKLRLLAQEIERAGRSIDAARGLEAYVADTIGTAEQLLDVLDGPRR